MRSVKRFDPDAVVLDLEDAVPKALKTQTRRTVREAIEILRGLEIDAFVRINRLDEGGSEDVLAVAAPGFSGVMLPKARDAKQVLALDGLLSFAEGQIGWSISRLQFSRCRKRRRALLTHGNLLPQAIGYGVWLRWSADQSLATLPEPWG